MHGNLFLKLDHLIEFSLEESMIVGSVGLTLALVCESYALLKLNGYPVA